MTTADILRLRLYNEQLVHPQFKTAAEVVKHLGAVQSQDYAGAKWALAQRLENTSEASLDEAYDNGEILRTHALRPTWHFVHPDDILWILSLNAPGYKRIAKYYYSQLGLTEKLMKQSQEIIHNALHGGKALTRTELGEFLLKANIPGTGQALGHVMGEAEIDGVVCSGPRRGKQFTYMLISERAPHAKQLNKQESLAELTKRYFTSHGPAQMKDFAWWTGLPVADVKEGLELNKSSLMKEIIDGKEYWFSDKVHYGKEMPKAAYLLPNYDEYAIAYKDREAFYDPAHGEISSSRGNLIFGHMIFIEGKIVGMWRRTLLKKHVEIETLVHRELSSDETHRLHKAAEQYGKFLGLDVIIK